MASSGIETNRASTSLLVDIIEKQVGNVLNVRLRPFSYALGFRGSVRKVIAEFERNAIDGNWGRHLPGADIQRDRFLLEFDGEGLCVYEERAIGVRPGSPFSRLRTLAQRRPDFSEEGFLYRRLWTLRRNRTDSYAYREERTKYAYDYASVRDPITNWRDVRCGADWRIISYLQTGFGVDHDMRFDYDDYGRLVDVECSADQPIRAARVSYGTDGEAGLTINYRTAQSEFAYRSRDRSRLLVKTYEYLGLKDYTFLLDDAGVVLGETDTDGRLTMKAYMFDGHNNWIAAKCEPCHTHWSTSPFGDPELDWPTRPWGAAQRRIHYGANYLD